MTENKFVSYLIYAIGEIFLVVIGILIALQINNWNEDRKSKQELNNILQIVADDLRNDTTEIGGLIDWYEPRRQTVLSILQDSLTMEEFKKCNDCPTIIAGYLPFSPDLRGYDLLRESTKTNPSTQDSLEVQIVEFYSRSIKRLDISQQYVDEEVKSTLAFWRDNYDWYSELIDFSTPTDPMFFEYAYRNPLYLNRVASFHLMLHRNYVPAFSDFEEEASDLLTKINKRFRNSQ